MIGHNSKSKNKSKYAIVLRFAYYSVNVPEFQKVVDIFWKYGFTLFADPKEGRVVFVGGPNVDAISCALVIQKLSEKLQWFHSHLVSEASMIRIEEETDLTRLIKKVEP